MTFDKVKSKFDELYQDLREANDEHAPSSWTWVFETLAEMQEDRGWDEVEVATHKKWMNRLGVEKPIAFVWECNGRTLTAIGADVAESDVRDLLASCMGLTEN